MGVVLISGKIFPNAIFGVLLFVLILWSKGQVACLNEIGGMHNFLRDYVIIHKYHK